MKSPLTDRLSQLFRKQTHEVPRPIVIELEDIHDFGNFPTVSAGQYLGSRFGDSLTFIPDPGQEYVGTPEEYFRANQFLFTLNTVYSYHLPLRLSPDIFWMLLVQGVAEHIRLNSGDFQHVLVNHEGKATLKVENDRLLTDELEWLTIPASFSEALKQHLAEKAGLVDLLLPVFSTTNGHALNAFRTGMLDMYSSYYTYELSSRCGIAAIVLEGTKEDWEKMRADFIAISEIVQLTWWSDTISQHLSKIIDIFDGKSDIDFIKNIYKINKESGGPFITGWIVDFFPYLKATCYGGHESFYEGGADAILHKTPAGASNAIWVTGRNPYIGKEVPPILRDDAFHTGISYAKFIWCTPAATTNMELAGGFLGMGQDPKTKALYPIVNWVVKQASPTAEYPG